MKEVGSFLAVVGFVLLYGAILIGSWFMPTIIAFRRRHAHRWAILMVNALLGPTIFGWILAPVWARNPPRDETSVLSRTLTDFTHLFEQRDAERSPDGDRPLIASDPIGEIERLSQLRASGHLNDAEFEVLKSRALSKATRPRGRRELARSH